MTEKERKELIGLIEFGQAIPPHLLRKISPPQLGKNQIGREYSLLYDGKMRREEVLANTPAAPWQLVRRFSSDNPHVEKKWHNLLVWGDNLPALKELLDDQKGQNKYGTRDKIKLIYIDPPFATKQDFMKDREKAYRDKVIGSEFIEFLRRRLILLHEVLANDGVMYVHLDYKKSHYIKAILDEVFGEENFQNEIVWERTNAHNMPTKTFARAQDTIFLYSKSDLFHFNKLRLGYGEAQLRRFKRDKDGRLYTGRDLTFSGDNAKRQDAWRGSKPPRGRCWGSSIEQREKWWAAGLILTKKDGTPRLDGLKTYLEDLEGKPINTIWNDLGRIGNTSDERSDYPTQKPEVLLDRIIRASSKEGDIVMDCFSGSGTTPVVAEKLNRRWIAMDCGKLAMYTIQSRLFSLTSVIGSGKRDDRTETERTEDWGDHLKNNPGILLISEKARKGECEINIQMMEELADLILKYGLLKKDAALSLVCPENKLLIGKKLLKEVEEGAGLWSINVKGVDFRISTISPKEKQDAEKTLRSKEFALYRAGIYDMTLVKEMDWAQYKPFVLKLFGVREHEHKRYGVFLDGYIGTDSALVWNFPDFKKLTLDYEYVDNIHSTLHGKPGEKFYVIAPVISMDFAEDEIRREETTYIFLKVPLSILMRLIEKHEPAALKQPSNENDVNEVIDAVGFDFVSQPVVSVTPKVVKQKGELFNEFVLQLKEFRSQTLATEPEDFANFETLSIAMVDLDYDGKIFRLTKVFWGDDLVKEAGGLEQAKELAIRLPEESFKGKQMMVIFCDRYGNEKSFIFSRGDFGVESSKSKKKTIRRKSSK